MENKRSDFESVVYMLWLVFPVPHLNLTSKYHLEIQRHSSPSILATRNSYEASSNTPASFQAWCHSIPLGATCLSAPSNTPYTFYNTPTCLSAHYHTYNNPQQLSSAHKALVLQRHDCVRHRGQGGRNREASGTCRDCHSNLVMSHEIELQRNFGAHKDFENNIEIARHLWM